MKNFLLYLSLLTLFHSASAWAEYSTLKTSLKNSQGNATGQARFQETKAGVALVVDVYGLKPGLHGIHIHEFGKCDAPDFKSAGEHFNPTQKRHGLQNPEGHHQGDMPNLEVDQNGKGHFEFVLANLSLSNNLRDKSLVIHESQDDQITDPSGNSGARIACGVIP